MNGAIVAILVENLHTLAPAKKLWYSRFLLIGMRIFLHSGLKFGRGMRVLNGLLKARPCYQKWVKYLVWVLDKSSNFGQILISVKKTWKWPKNGSKSRICFCFDPRRRNLSRGWWNYFDHLVKNLSFWGQNICWIWVVGGVSTKPRHASKNSPLLSPSTNSIPAQISAIMGESWNGVDLKKWLRDFWATLCFLEGVLQNADFDLTCIHMVLFVPLSATEHRATLACWQNWIFSVEHLIEATTVPINKNLNLWIETENYSENQIQDEWPHSASAIPLHRFQYFRLWGLKME